MFTLNAKGGGYPIGNKSHFELVGWNDQMDLSGKFGPSEKYKNMNGFPRYICWSMNLWILEFI